MNSDVRMSITPEILRRTPDTLLSFKSCLNSEVNKPAITSIIPCPIENKNSNIAALRIFAFIEA